MILRILKNSEEPMTVYQIWSSLGRKYSLRGIYKAVDSLESKDMVSVKYDIKDRRKIFRVSIRKALSTKLDRHII